MSSPIHSKVLSRLSLVVPSVVLTCFSLTVFPSFAQGLPETEVFGSLTVTWIDENTVQVSGYGNGGGDYTNALGSCTNCLAISPEEMAALKSQLIASINGCKNLTETIHRAGIAVMDELGLRKDEISTFQRFGNSPIESVSTSTEEYRSFTNYVYNVENSQTLLDRANRPSASNSAAASRWIGYNNGIYDYASNVLYPSLSRIGANLDTILFTNDQLSASLDSLRYQVNDITEESCRGSCSSDGGGTNSTSCSSCPCQEQWVALLDYVKHIDDDQHKRHLQLNQISNNVYNLDTTFDSYAKLVSGSLYNDGSIVLADDETWTNVYFSGESENYPYDKSNILQRIELILFGIAHGTNNYSAAAFSATNDLDDVSASNITNQFNSFSSGSTNSFLHAKERLEAKVNSIKSISAMFVFWGTPGSNSPFALGYVPNLDGSEGGQYIEVGNGFLGSEVSRFHALCRYGFQLIWATVFLFLVWLFYLRLFKYVLIFLKYAFEWINEAFAS